MFDVFFFFQILKTDIFVKYFKSENNQLIMCQQIFFIDFNPPELITNMLIIVVISVLYICGMRSGVQNSDKTLHKEIYLNFLVFVIFLYHDGHFYTISSFFVVVSLLN